MTKAKNLELERLKFELEYNLDNGMDFTNRIIRITGTIGEPSGLSPDEDYFDYNLLEVALTKMEMDNPLLPVTIKVHSYGGSVYDALAIVGRIKASPCHIITEGFGAVMSAATLILMCGDHRKLSRYAVSMFHSAQYGAHGDHDMIKEQVKQADIEEKLWAKYYSEFSNKSAKFWLSKIKKTEYYPLADEMLAMNAVDEII